jgi:hypothetical protein
MIDLLENVDVAKNVIGQLSEILKSENGRP